MSKDIEKVNKDAEIKEEKNAVRYREGKVVVEYRKPSFFMSLLLILIGVCIATIILTLLYIFKLKPENGVPKEPQEHEEIVIDNNEEKVEETKVPDVDLSIEGEFVKELHDKIPVAYFLQETYSQNVTTKSRITDLNKTRFVVEKFRNNSEEVPFESVKDELTSGKYTGSSGETISTVIKIPEEKVLASYKSIFGDDSILRENIETDMGYIYEYSASSKCYYGHSYAGGGGFGFCFGTKLTDAKRSDDGKEIYVYDKYIKVAEDWTTTPHMYKVYQFSDVTNSIDEVTEELYHYDDTIKMVKIDDSTFDKYLDKLITFKSTFKLDDDGNYYWFSTQPEI